MAEELWDVLVVGGGPAGYTAGLYAARAGLRTLVLTGAEPGGQLGTTETVENYPGVAAAGGAELAERLRRSAADAGAVLRPEQVTALELAGVEKQAVTAAGIRRGRTVIYAAGAAPRTLGVPGEAELRGRGVSFCAACDGMFFKNRTVAVVGGGNSAAAEAITLSRLCRRVYVIHRRSALRAEEHYQAILARAKNVTFLWNTQATAVLGEQAVRGLACRELSGGGERTLACDGVFVAVGRSPNTDLVKGQLTLDARGYVAADETTRTELPGVFAAGDVRTKPFRQIVTAAADGAVAAHQAAEQVKG